MDKDLDTNIIFYGDRTEKFNELIYNILKRGKLREKYIKILMSEDNMKQYSIAFTAKSADPINNFEVYEQLGDVSANKFIVDYMYKRFPQFRNTEGVQIVALLRIKYGAKQSFFKIAQNLGFWPFVSASEDCRKRKMKPLLEDTLEAFLGCTEFLLDTQFRTGVGYGILYDILKSIFDDIHIPLSYETLKDPKTRLKELFDPYLKKEMNELGTLYYEDVKKDTLFYSRAYRIHNGVYYLIGEGTASLKIDAQQKAAENGIQTLKTYGFVNDIPPIYKNLK